MSKVKDIVTDEDLKSTGAKQTKKYNAIIVALLIAIMSVSGVLIKQTVAEKSAAMNNQPQAPIEAVYEEPAKPSVSVAPSTTQNQTGYIISNGEIYTQRGGESYAKCVKKDETGTKTFFVEIIDNNYTLPEGAEFVDVVIARPYSELNSGIMDYVEEQRVQSETFFNR